MKQSSAIQNLLKSCCTCSLKNSSNQQVHSSNCNVEEALKQFNKIRRANSNSMLKMCQESQQSKKSSPHKISVQHPGTPDNLGKLTGIIQDIQQKCETAF